MNSLLSVVLALGLSQAGETAPAPQAPSGASVEQSAAQAASAAERAARAAESAAESAARTASAVEKLAQRAAPETLPAPAAAPAPAPSQPKAPAWTGSVSAGLISLTGNARSITTTATAAASRQTENWIYALKASGAYGQSRPAEAAEAADPETVALNAALEARGERRFTERYSGYLLAGALTDHVKSVEALPYGEAGLSILWLDQIEGDLVRLRLRTDLAFRYGEEIRYQYYPTPVDIEDVTIAAPKLGVNFRYALSKDVIFTEDLEVLPTVLGPSRVLLNSTTKLSARLVSALSLGVSFLVKHDSLPAEGKVPTDTALNVGLEVGF